MDTLAPAFSKAFNDLLKLGLSRELLKGVSLNLKKPGREKIKSLKSCIFQHGLWKRVLQKMGTQLFVLSLVWQILMLSSDVQLCFLPFILQALQAPYVLLGCKWLVSIPCVLLIYINFSRAQQCCCFCEHKRNRVVPRNMKSERQMLAMWKNSIDYWWTLGYSRRGTSRVMS